MLQVSQQRERLDETQRRENEMLLLRKSDLDNQMESMQDKFRMRMLEFTSRRLILDRVLEKRTYSRSEEWSGDEDLSRKE